MVLGSRAHSNICPVTNQKSFRCNRNLCNSFTLCTGQQSQLGMITVVCPLFMMSNAWWWHHNSIVDGRHYSAWEMMFLLIKANKNEDISLYVLPYGWSLWKICWKVFVQDSVWSILLQSLSKFSLVLTTYNNNSIMLAISFYWIWNGLIFLFLFFLWAHPELRMLGWSKWHFTGFAMTCILDVIPAVI